MMAKFAFTGDPNARGRDPAKSCIMGGVEFPRDVGINVADDVLAARLRRHSHFTERPEALAAPPAAIKAEHHGGGKFRITQGETVLASGLNKADADAFNAMSEEDKAAYIATLTPSP